nr:immunoglobulin light chain junction region [Macaca mulatta]
CQVWDISSDHGVF